MVLQHDELRGRHWIAQSWIAAGTMLVCDSPFSAVLRRKYCPVTLTHLLLRKAASLHSHITYQSLLLQQHSDLSSSSFFVNLSSSSSDYYLNLLGSHDDLRSSIFGICCCQWCFVSYHEVGRLSLLSKLCHCLVLFLSVQALSSTISSI